MEKEAVITVTILINGQPIFTRTAVNRVTTKEMSPVTTYEVDEGTFLKHRREDGAVKLAIKMLGTIKEQKKEEASIKNYCKEPDCQRER